MLTQHPGTTLPPIVGTSGHLTRTLIINADDWGRDRANSDQIFDCFVHGRLSSVSAMAFMEDSERAAAIAQERGIDAALHLNFTTSFTAPWCTSKLKEHQERTARYLRRNRVTQLLFNPALARSFEYLTKTQLEEFERLYGISPKRIDGHHHMHLCANVLLGKLIPAGTQVRRNFSFLPGEKSWLNRLYRERVDRRLESRHRVVDYFFPLAPIEPIDRLKRIWSLAERSVVEVETHPVNPEEYWFLLNHELPLN
jgi:chitin disaccharide deacetylase